MFRNVENQRTRFIFRESPPLLQMEKEFASAQKVEHKVELRFGLECPAELHEERVLGLGENVAFGPCVIDLQCNASTDQD